jgi:TPR repeat protein
MDDPRAIRYLACMRFHGAGIPRDGDGAISLIRERAKDAGMRLSDLISLEPNEFLFEEGIEHLEMAAEKGDPEAVFRYLKHTDVTAPADRRRVYEGMTRLAKDGFYDGCLHVGISLAAEKPQRAAKWLWKVLQAGPWNEVGRLAERAFAAGHHDVALQLWLELADMGMEVGAFNAGVALCMWNQTGASPPFGWGEKTRLKLATRMFKRSYRLGFQDANELVVQSYILRGSKDKADKWLRALLTPKAKLTPTDDL